MFNRKINVLLIGDTTEKCHFCCHVGNQVNNTQFSIDAWFEEERSNDNEFLAYIKSKRESTKDGVFAVIYVEGAKEKRIEMVESNKLHHWVSSKYDGGDNKACVINCLIDVVKQAQRSFSTVFYGTTPKTLKDTTLEKIPSELFSIINHYSFYKPRTIEPYCKPSYTTVFQENHSKYIKGTHLENVPTDLHATINHYLLYQPRPKMEVPKEEPQSERRNTRETCIIN